MDPPLYSILNCYFILSKASFTTNHNLGRFSSPESSTLLSQRLCDSHDTGFKWKPQHFCISTGSTNGIFSITGDLNTYNLHTARASNAQLPSCRIAGASSSWSGLSVGSSGCWVSSFLTWWQVYFCLTGRCLNSENLQIHENDRKCNSLLI